MNITGKIRNFVMCVFLFLIIMFFKVVIANADITKLMASSKNQYLKSKQI